MIVPLKTDLTRVPSTSKNKILFILFYKKIAENLSQVEIFFFRINIDLMTKLILANSAEESDLRNILMNHNDNFNNLLLPARDFKFYFI